MRLKTFLLSAIVTALCVAPAEARGDRHLQPTSKWVVEYADDTCRLAREFGEGSERVTLFFEQFVPGDAFNLTFVGRSMGGAGPSKASVRFGPNETVDPDNPVSLATVGSTPAILLGGFQRLASSTEAERLAALEALKNDLPYEPAPIGAERERAATWLELGKVLPFDVVLHTGPMDKPLGALRQCSWDTIKSWGLSIEEQKTLTRHARPTTPSSSWFSDNDYPSEMVRGGYEGNVNFRVIVDATGTPVSCHVQSSTRPQAFDEVICRQVMKRGKFHPALDASGKPIKSYWRQTALFRLGG